MRRPALGCVEQQLVDELAGPTVEGPAEGTEAGEDGVVEVGAGRGGHPDSQGRGGQLVIGQNDERGVDGADKLGGRRARGQANGQAGGHRVGLRSPGAVEGQAG